MAALNPTEPSTTSVTWMPSRPTVSALTNSVIVAVNNPRPATSSRRRFFARDSATRKVLGHNSISATTPTTR